MEFSLIDNMLVGHKLSNYEDTFAIPMYDLKSQVPTVCRVEYTIKKTLLRQSAQLVRARYW